MESRIRCSKSRLKTLKNVLIQNKSAYRNTLYGLVLGVILTLFGINNAPENVELLSFGMIGSSLSEGKLGIFELILFTLPLLVNLTLFGTVIETDMNETGIFLFIRSHNRKKRMAEQMLVVLSASVLFDILTFVPLIIGSTIWGIPVYSFSTLMTVILSWLACTVLCHCMFVLVMNVMTVKFPMMPCLLFMCALYASGHVVMAYMPKTLNGIIAALHPSVQAIIGAHNIESLQNMFPYYFVNNIQYFTVYYSAAYSCSVIILTIVVGMRIIKKHDFLN